MKNLILIFILFTCWKSNSTISAQNTLSPPFYVDLDVFYLILSVDYGMSGGFMLNEQTGIGVGYSYAKHYSLNNRCKEFTAVGLQLRRHSIDQKLFSKYEIGLIRNYQQWQCFEAEGEGWTYLPDINPYAKMQFGLRFAEKFSLSTAFTLAPNVYEETPGFFNPIRRQNPVFMFSILFGVQLDFHSLKD